MLLKKNIATSEMGPFDFNSKKIHRLAVFSYDSIQDVWNKVQGKWDWPGKFM